MRSAQIIRTVVWYIDITQKSENSLEVSVETIAKMIQRVPIFNDAKNYDNKEYSTLIDRLRSKQIKKISPKIDNTSLEPQNAWG